jgi:hypothetical protein
MKTNEVPFKANRPAGGSPLPSDLDNLADRHVRCGTEGHLRAVLTGGESEAELRALALQCVEACPVDCGQNQCPFRIIGNLYHVSSRALINSLSRRGLASLFEAKVESQRCAFVRGRTQRRGPGK